MRFVGMDGCKAGWLAVTVTEGREVEAQVVPSLRALASVADADLILIDIPIGLRESGPEERLCDRLARQMLGPRRSSVFPAPARPALLNRDYRSASESNAAATGRHLSRQSWSLCPKIAEVDDYLRTRKDGPRVREMHPEICFWGLGGGHPMAHPKRTEAGFQERLALLTHHFPEAPEFVSCVERTHRRNLLGSDDILDALAGAVTGWLGRQALSSVPDVPEPDAHGLPMEMVYWRS